MTIKKYNIRKIRPFSRWKSVFVISNRIFLFITIALLLSFVLWLEYNFGAAEVIWNTLF